MKAKAAFYYLVIGVLLLIARIATAQTTAMQATFGADSRHHGPLLIVFGNPTAGTPLMQGTQEIAIDLPQKFLVSQHRDGVVITDNDPLFVARRANLVGQDMRLNAIANALANFAVAGAGTADNE